MAELVGSVLFLSSVGLSGVKLANDFGDHGLWGYAMLMVLIFIYAAAVGIVFG